MIVRFLALCSLFWMIGFAWFAVFLPQPLDGRKTDAIVVLTGGAGRIDRGLSLMRDGAAKRMLISGVNLDVRTSELAAAYKTSRDLFDCCITLGREAVDTRSNAIEVSRWIKRRKYKSVRVVTTDWHMRRATYELRKAMPMETKIYVDAVPSQPTLSVLILEYNKYVLRRAAGLIGV